MCHHLHQSKECACHLCSEVYYGCYSNEGGLPKSAGVVTTPDFESKRKCKYCILETLLELLCVPWAEIEDQGAMAPLNLKTPCEFNL